MSLACASSFPWAVSLWSSPANLARPLGHLKGLNTHLYLVSPTDTLIYLTWACPEHWTFRRSPDDCNAQARGRNTALRKLSGAAGAWGIAYHVASRRKGREEVDGVSERTEGTGKRRKLNQHTWWGAGWNKQGHSQHSLNLACGSQMEWDSLVLRKILLFFLSWKWGILIVLVQTAVTKQQSLDGLKHEKLFPTVLKIEKSEIRVLEDSVSSLLPHVQTAIFSPHVTKSTCSLSLFIDGHTDPIMGAMPSWPQVGPMTSQRPCLLIPLRRGLSLQHTDGGETQTRSPH